MQQSATTQLARPHFQRKKLRTGYFLNRNRTNSPSTAILGHKISQRTSFETSTKTVCPCSPVKVGDEQEHCKTTLGWPQSFVTPNVSPLHR